MQELLDRTAEDRKQMQGIGKDISASGHASSSRIDKSPSSSPFSVTLLVLFIFRELLIASSFMFDSKE